MSTSDELQKLIALRDSGEISAEEFETLKGKLINPGPAEPQTLNVEVKKKKSLGCFGIGCISIVVLFLAAGIIGANSSDETDFGDTSSSSTSDGGETTPAVTDTPAELHDALVAELGAKTNMDVPRDIRVELSGDNGDELFIQLVMDDNLTNKMARGSAWQDTAKVLKLAQSSTFAKDLTITFTTELFDEYGASLGQTNVLTFWFDQDAFSKIVPDNLVGEEMWTGAATSVFIHPVLQGD